ncbi:MAG: undecaprenyldiphospho-muramoylpentapeptide beta-N-acetylglucosaminyltransferase [Planctomycetaceae bacterium]|nr:undecaprenyldiphospho-muramoylpentapeptide beta-N-acetylglucosaminyltransferase [Planctomycetaceae bacterium]
MPDVTTRSRFVFAGGGTGGHLTPGLAVAKELRQTFADCQIVFVGSDRPIEWQMIDQAGYEHRALPVKSTATLRRQPLRFAAGLWQAYRQSRTLLKTLAPRAVIGLGGFASVPQVWAAARAGIPTIVLEQNTIPGRANRFLGRMADAVCLSFESSRARFPRGSCSITTGNPVRPEIAALSQINRGAAAGSPETLLILGGSQGATGLNEAVRLMLEASGGRWNRLRLVHQTGAAQCEALRADYEARSLNHFVEPFFPDMASLYREATLVISRGGATTLAELACAGLPAVVVPYPYAADDHQWHNAEHYRCAGAARIVRQAADPHDTASELYRVVDELLKDRPSLAAMGQAMHSLARPDAARSVAQVLQSLIEAPIK